YVARADAVMPRRQGVPEFVQHDAAENHHDENHARNGAHEVVPLGPEIVKDEQDEQPEGGVDVDADARDFSDLPGPAHVRAPRDRTSSVSISKFKLTLRRRARQALQGRMTARGKR